MYQFVRNFIPKFYPIPIVLPKYAQLCAIAKSSIIDFYVVNIIGSDHTTGRSEKIQVLATLLQDFFLVFMAVLPNEYKASKI